MKNMRASKKDSRGEVGRKLAEPQRRGAGASRAVRMAVQSPTHWVEDALSYGRDRPLISLFVALGAGVGLGWLASARREHAPKKLIPAVAGAVAQAVHEAINSRR